MCGTLLNSDLLLADLLARCGYDVTVPRHPVVPARLSELGGSLHAIGEQHIWNYRSGLEFIRRVNEFDVIVMHGMSLSSYLGRLWPLGIFWRLPPMIIMAAGSDMREQARWRTIPGWRTRMLMRRAYRLNPGPDTGSIAVLQSLGLKNWEFYRFPYAIDKPLPPPPATGPVVYLLASRLDWGDTERHLQRIAHKGNDRFVRTFLRRAEAGQDIRLIVMDRGSDRELARKMVDASPARDRVEWQAPTTQAGLRDVIHRAHVVVDQFVIGSQSSLTIETMAAGRAVMTYIDDAILSLIYEDLPLPVINCRTEEEIEAAIMRYSSRAELIALGNRAAEWIDRNHRALAAYNRLFNAIDIAAGRAPGSRHATAAELAARMKAPLETK